MKHLKRITVCLLLGLLGVGLLRADDFKVAREGDMTVGVSENGDMFMVNTSGQGNGAAVFPNTANSAATFIQYDSQSRVSSITGNSVTEFQYDGASTTVTGYNSDGSKKQQTIPPQENANMPKSSVGGIIGWLDQGLESISKNKVFGGTVIAIEKAEMFLNLAKNADDPIKMADIGYGDLFETYGNIKELMEWVTTKSALSSGWIVAKTLAKLIANYAEWRNKWAELCYQYMLELDKQKKANPTKSGMLVEEELLLNPPDDKIWAQVPDELYKQKPKDDNDNGSETEDTSEDGNEDEGGLDGDITLPPFGTINISRKHLLEPLTEQEIAVVRSQLGEECEAACRQWVKSIPKIKSSEGKACHDDLHKLTYDDYLQYVHSFYEVLALNVLNMTSDREKQLEKVLPKLLVLKAPFLAVYKSKGYTIDDGIVQIVQAQKQLPFGQAIEKYELYKYMF